MSTRNLEFARQSNQSKVSDEIMAMFFTASSNSRILRHKFNSSFVYNEIVDVAIFSSSFFQNSLEILVCFPSQNDLEVHISNNQDELCSYLSSKDTIDFETDIYLFSPDMKWCIRYLDEFLDDNSRMTFLHSNDQLI